MRFAYNSSRTAAWKRLHFFLRQRAVSKPPMALISSGITNQGLACRRGNPDNHVASGMPMKAMRDARDRDCIRQLKNGIWDSVKPALEAQWDLRTSMACILYLLQTVNESFAISISLKRN
jgi:hypothetical protein